MDQAFKVYGFLLQRLHLLSPLCVNVNARCVMSLAWLVPCSERQTKLLAIFQPFINVCVFRP